MWNILYDIYEDREDELAVSDLYSQQVFNLSGSDDDGGGIGKSDDDRVRYEPHYEAEL